MAQKAFRVPENPIAKQSECNAGRLLAINWYL